MHGEVARWHDLVRGREHVEEERERARVLEQERSGGEEEKWNGQELELAHYYSRGLAFVAEKKRRYEMNTQQSERIERS